MERHPGQPDPEPTARRYRPNGLSLVELLVALAVTAVVLLAVYGAFSAHQGVYAREQLILEMQQNMRTALDVVAHIVQQAGYWRCMDPEAVAGGAPGVKNTLNRPETLFHTHPVVGFNQVSVASDPFADKDTRIDTDVLGYSLVDPAFHGPLGQDQDTPKDPVPVVKNRATSSVKKGDILFVTDCRSGAVFQVTAVTTSGTLVLFHHDPGMGTPGNITRCLRCDDGGSACVDEDSCTSSGTGFRRGVSSVHPVKVGYFRVNKKGQFQWIEGGPGTGGQYTFAGPRSLVENVEDFQVEYGVNSGRVPEGHVESWVSADAVPDVSPADGIPDWDRVLAVRCHLLGRTKRAFKDYVDTRVYDFADRVAGAAGDGYRRIHVVKTVWIRNAAP